MKITNEEQAAIIVVVGYGKAFGFGNLIAHLNSAWAATLMEKHGFDEETARSSTHGNGYPIAMHRDLMNNGEWDETGASYAAQPTLPKPKRSRKKT